MGLRVPVKVADHGIRQRTYIMVRQAQHTHTCRDGGHAFDRLKKRYGVQGHIRLRFFWGGHFGYLNAQGLADLTPRHHNMCGLRQ